MKKLMFAQSRFVFMAGGPEASAHAEAVKQMQEMLKEPAKDLAMKQNEADRLDRLARDTISKLPDDEQRPARLKLIQLKSTLDTAIATAKEKQGMSDQTEVDKLLEAGKDFLAVKEAEVKIALKQAALKKRIEEARNFYKIFLNGDAIDGDLRLDLEDAMTNLWQITSEVEKAPAIDSTDAEMDKWASDLNAQVDKYDVTSDAIKEAFANKERRNQIREKVANDKSVMGNLRGNLRQLAADNGGDVSGADTLLAALYAIQEPVNRSGKEAWEKYSNDIQSAVTQLTAGKDDFMKQIQEKRTLDDNIKGKLGKVIEGWDFQKGPELIKAQKKAEDALKEIGSIGPKFGDTSRHNAYLLAAAKAELVMNEFNGEKASQDVVKSGGRDTLLVYKDLQAGKFKTVAEFQKAFKDALEKDKMVVGYNPDGNIAILEEAATTLKNIGTSKLEQQEAITNMVTGAVEGISNIVDYAGEVIAKAGDQARYEAALKSVADAKSSLEGKRGAAVRKALKALNEIRMTAPEQQYSDDGAVNPGELTYSYPPEQVKTILAKYEKDAAKERQVAAAKRRAAREAAAKEAAAAKQLETEPINREAEGPTAIPEAEAEAETDSTVDTAQAPTNAGSVSSAKE